MKTTATLITCLSLHAFAPLAAQSSQSTHTFEQAEARLELEGDPSALEAVAKRDDEAGKRARARLERLRAASQGDADARAIRAIVDQWLSRPSQSVEQELTWIGEAALPVLIERFNESTTNLALAGRIASRILAVGGDRAAAWLERVFEDERGLSRSVVVRNISRMHIQDGSDALKKSIFRFAQEPDPKLREAFVKNVAASLPPDQYNALLRDPADAVRNAALSQIGSYIQSGGDMRSGAVSTTQYSADQMNRFRAIIPDLRRLLAEPMSEQATTALRQALQSGPAASMLGAPEIEGSIDLLLDVLPRFKMQGIWGPVAAIPTSKILACYERCVEAGLVQAIPIAQLLQTSSHQWSEDDVVPFLQLAQKWSWNERSGNVASMVSALSKKVQEYMTQGHVDELAAAYGAKLLGPVKELNKYILEKDWVPAIRNALRQRWDRGDFLKRSADYYDAYDLLMNSMDVATADWAIRVLEATKDDRLWGSTAFKIPARPEFLPHIAKLLGAGIGSSYSSLSGKLFRDLLKLAPSEGHPVLARALAAPLGRTRHTITLPDGRSKTESYGPGQWMFLSKDEAWEHDLALSALRPLAEQFLDPARNAARSHNEWNNIAQVFGKASFRAPGSKTPMTYRIPATCLDYVRNRLDAIPSANARNRFAETIAWNYQFLADPAGYVRETLERGRPNVKRQLLQAMRRDAQLSKLDSKLRALAIPALGDSESIALYARPLLHDVTESELAARIDAAALAMLDSEETQVRLGGLAFISERGGEKLQKAAMRLLKDPDALVRSKAIAVVRTHFMPDAVDDLLSLLRDESESVREAAKHALDEIRYLQEQENHWKSWLAKRGQPSVSAALLAQASADQDLPIRIAAIRSLGSLGEVESLPFLIDLMKSENVEIRDAASTAVSTIQRIAAARATQAEEVAPKK